MSVIACLQQLSLFRLEVRTNRVYSAEIENGYCQRSHL